MAGRVRRLAAAVAVAGVVLMMVPAAQAATGSPPVTNPDHVTLRAGEGISVDVTANDIDPDGTQLDVCRLGPLPAALRESFVAQGDLVVQAGRTARGSYTLTYYACDESYLTAGTLTVTVRPAPPTFDIIPVGDAPPGRLRLVNTYKNQTFRCAWGALGSEKVDGRAVVRPRKTVVIQVREANLTISCTSPRSSYGADFVTSEGRLTRT